MRTDLSSGILTLAVIHQAATWAMTGVIWMVQRLNYPAMLALPANIFKDHHKVHVRNITGIVSVLMMVEAVSAGLLWLARPDGGIGLWISINLFLLILIWLITFAVQVRQHRALEKEHDRDILIRLVRWNWTRTVLWTARGVIVIFIVLSLAGAANAAPERRQDMTEEIALDHLSREEKIRTFFNTLSKDSIDLVDEFYDADVLFRDPIEEIRGIKDMKTYYASMYKNVRSITFQFQEIYSKEDSSVAVWVMTFEAEGLNSGKAIKVEGTSRMIFHPDTDKVVFHQDYFDVGQMVYEYVPVLGGMIRFVKGRMAIQ